MDHLTAAFAVRDLGLGGRGAHLVIPSILGPILAAVLVFNRVYWRIYLVHQIGLDDICILLSLVSPEMSSKAESELTSLARSSSSPNAPPTSLPLIMAMVDPRAHCQLTAHIVLFK